MDKSDRASHSPATGGRFFGYPDDALAGTWSIRELCSFLRVSERKARDVMKGPGAPGALRLGTDRCERWNPYQVVAWLHGAPDAAGTAVAVEPAAAPDAPDANVTAPDLVRAPVPGKPWKPGERP